MKIVTVAAILVLIVVIPLIMTKHKAKFLPKSSHGKWLLNEDSQYHISDFMI
ncbi:MAG: hypothetical protein O7D34_02590 [Ignavibacteria bacterium]|nr:hypothetical protein [Ignavibacteria bacterium]